MERPTAEGVGRGAGYIAGSNMITSLIAFAFYAAAARILGPRGMGEVTMLFLVIGLYTAVSLMGANYAAARFAPASTLTIRRPRDRGCAPAIDE
ncbi:MAG: oligosaccharide flippase family protein [Nitrososphaeria archaeon]